MFVSWWSFFTSSKMGSGLKMPGVLASLIELLFHASAESFVPVRLYPGLVCNFITRTRACRT